MITKILYSLENVQLESDPIQIIGMSATLPNLDEVCEWMNATIYMTDYRPVSINEFIKVRDKIYKAKDFVNGVYDQPVQGLEKEFPKIVNDRRDRLKILPLILQTVLNKANDEGLAQLDRQAGATGSVLVFCPSKQQCEITCKNLNEIAKEYGIDINTDQKKRLDEEEKSKNFERLSTLSRVSNTSISNYKLNELIRTKISNVILRDMINNGFAYHHSGLSTLERDIIERAFREGIIKILFCTSTLAAGVNLPAKRVIIASIKIGREILSDTSYKQMVGRAGRFGYDTSGDSFLICVAEEKQAVIDIVGHEMKLKPVKSCLASVDRGMRKMILDCICSKITCDDLSLKKYLKLSLLYHQLVNKENSLIKNAEDKGMPAWIEILETGKQAINFLAYNDIVIEEAIGSVCERMHDPFNFEEKWSSIEGKYNEENEKPCRKYRPSKLGNAILKSGLLPEEGLIIYLDLFKAQNCLVLQNELHLLYLLTPVSMPEITVNWTLYSKIFDKLNPIEQMILDKIGIEEPHVAMAADSKCIVNSGVLDVKQSNLSISPKKKNNAVDKFTAAQQTAYKSKQDGKLVAHNSDNISYQFIEVNRGLIKDLRHVRFFITLMIKDLITCSDLDYLSSRYSTSKGSLQTLK